MDAKSACSCKSGASRTRTCSIPISPSFLKVRKLTLIGLMVCTCVHMHLLQGRNTLRCNCVHMSYNYNCDRLVTSNPRLAPPHVTRTCAQNPKPVWSVWPHDYAQHPGCKALLSFTMLLLSFLKTCSCHSHLSMQTLLMMTRHHILEGQNRSRLFVGRECCKNEGLHVKHTTLCTQCTITYKVASTWQRTFTRVGWL